MSWWTGITPTIPAQQKVTKLPFTILKRYHKQLYLKMHNCTRGLCKGEERMVISSAFAFYAFLF